MDYLSDDDVMLRLAIIVSNHTKPKKIGKLVCDMLWRLPKEKRAGLYMITGAKDPVAVIKEALLAYEITPL